MLSVDTARYQPVADKVVNKLSSTLNCLVLVASHDDVVIASNERLHVGENVASIVNARSCSWLQVPLPFDCDRLEGRVIVEQPQDVDLNVTRLTDALVEMVINEVVAENWLPDQAEIKNKFIYDVLHGHINNPDFMTREAQILGMDLSQPRSVILIDAGNFIYQSDTERALDGASARLRARQRARFIIASIVGFFELPDDTICAHIGDGEIVVLKAVSRQTLRRWSEHDTIDRADGWVDLQALRRAATGLLKRLSNDSRSSISIGIGRYHSGADGLARSYSDARIALKVGTRYHGPDNVHSIDDLGLAAFIGGADERTKVDLAERLLNPLQDEPDLFNTLTTYFDEGCCASSTVARLSIHRNTLGHRLQKISTLVGLDPREFDDAVQLRLALLVLTTRDQ